MFGITNPEHEATYIVQLLTASGPLCERYATYEEAQHRIDLFPAEQLLTTPLIFRELADGSQRVVREDGKPLQMHRLPWDEPSAAASEPLPLAEPLPPDQGGPQIRFIEPEPEELEPLL